MKSVIIALFFLFFGVCSAQEGTATSQSELYALDGPETYELDSQVFTFIPEPKSINIRKLENKKELDFGRLRRTTNDGLYIMTSIHYDEVSFGRFDSVGNFKTVRYDPEADIVLEEYYKRTKK